MPTPILTAGPIARSRNGVIGKDGGLPWRLKSDMAIFRAVTMGKPVIMGRKTWDSLPRKPLIGRTNIVLSRDGSFEPKQAVVCEDFAEAFAIAKEQAEEDGVEEVCVIGGASLFEMALPKAPLPHRGRRRGGGRRGALPHRREPLDRGAPRGLSGRRRRRLPLHLPGAGAALRSLTCPRVARP